MRYIWLILLFCVRPSKSKLPVLKPIDQKFAEQMLFLIQEILKGTNERIGHLSDIRQKAQGRPAFEVGYVMFNVQEKYRRMVNKYNTASFMRRRLFVMNFVFFLEEVELHYWEIDHLVNMMHEIERKYSVKGGINDDYEMPPTTETTSTVVTRPSIKWFTRSKSKKKHFKQEKYIAELLKPGTHPPAHKKNKWWPIEYGWEIDYYW